MLHPRRAVELFHLLLCRSIFSRGWSGRYELAVKGGASLRFFFGSPRFSEDIDLDSFLLCEATVRRINAALLSPSIERRLRAEGITAASRLVKRTDTSQRWKTDLLEDPDRERLVARTSIDSSCRSDPDAGSMVLSPPDERLLSAYELPPFEAMRYVGGAALAQKAHALGDRRIAQARDAFDIYWLHDEASQRFDRPMSDEVRHRAIEALLDLHWGDYASQVVPYLEPPADEEFGDEDRWNQMQDRVLAILEEAP